MKDFNEEQIFFMKDMLQNELVNLNLRRSQAQNVQIFDEIYSGRIQYIKDLIKHLNKLREK